MNVSIITPVFNRNHTITHSVESSIKYIEALGLSGEIIVVDDASSDSVSEILFSRFDEQLCSGLLRIITLDKNLGPTGAKQVGVESARGDWLVFMDSDDEFCTYFARDSWKFLTTLPTNCPVAFFRCVDKANGSLIGRPQTSTVCLDLVEFLNRGTPGECLPAVRRQCLVAIPFERDLRGFEGLTYARLIQRYGKAYVSPLTLRLYCTSEEGGRLSAKQSIKQRGCLLARGYIRMTQFFWFTLRWRLIAILVRIVYHSLNCITYTATSKLR